MRQRIALWICPELKDELAALRSGNTKAVLEIDRLHTEAEKDLIRAQLREGNRLAREVALKRGYKVHPRVPAIKAGSALPHP